MHCARPDSAPDFLLSRSHGSVRTQGSRASFTDVFEAIEALSNGEFEMIVGALPFDHNGPASLTVPNTIVREPGPLEPHPYYRVGPGAKLNASIDSFDPAPGEHLRRIEAAVSTIQNSVLDKVVLARAVDIAFDPPVDPRLVAARLIDMSYTKDGFIADLTPAGATGNMLVGSSPEMLVRRRGNHVSSYPLAGSAPRDFHDRAADKQAGEALCNSAKDLEEHAFVVDHIRGVLTPLCTDLNIPDRPTLTATNEMWHLATPIDGVLKAPAPSALDLAQRLYPTPAVCGTPTAAAEALICTAETDRRFYAGAVGYTEASGDGEYMVAIRCAEVSGDGTKARTWAGGGLIAESDPMDELDETTAKMRTIMRALGL